MAAVTENANSNVSDISIQSIEIVQFTTAASGDTYESKLFENIRGAFASQETVDGEEIQVSFDNTASPPKVTLTFETQSVVTGYLVIRGEK